MTEPVPGVVERHYLKCPLCDGRQDLDRRVCSGCGAKPVAVLWLPAGPTSPELVAVQRTYDDR